MNKKLMILSVMSTLVVATGPLFAAGDNHEKKVRSITIQGQGKVSAVPDVAMLGVEVSQEGADLDPVLVLVRKQMNKIFEVVKAQGIEEKDIRTDQFLVRPKYEQDKRNNPRRAGYVVSNRISVKVRDLKKTGKLLTVVMNAGATTVDGPNFEIDKPDVFEGQALAAATRDAKSKAETVAAAAGVQLGEILTLSPQAMNWPSPQRPMMMRAMAMPMAPEAEEPMFAGEQTLTGYVTITYAIR